MRLKLKIAGQAWWKDSGLRLYVKLLKTTKSEVGNLLFIRHWLGWEITRWLGLKVCPKSFLSRKWSLHPLHGVHHEAAAPDHRHLVQHLHAVPEKIHFWFLKVSWKGFLTWGWDGTRLIPGQLVGRASGEFQIWNSFMTLLTSNSFFLYSQIWMNNFSFFYLILPLQHFETKKLHKLSPSFEAFPSHPDNPIACKHCVLPGRIVMFYCAKKIGVCTYHS